MRLSRLILTNEKYFVRTTTQTEILVNTAIARPLLHSRVFLFPPPLFFSKCKLADERVERYNAAERVTV